jgi:hypothetical protein
MASFHHCIKSGAKGSAAAHSRYISREARGDLIYTSYGNLPEWANGPRYFWRMSDLHERSNGAAYREHEIALPLELTLEQLIEVAEELVRAIVGTKPYELAIHAPDGALGGISNPHIHLMYSDRIPDGINRAPEQMFRRYRRDRPEAGGCRKDSGGKSPLELRDEVIATRKMIADTQNLALAKHGHSTRVDHRSLRAQGLVRNPERHLGPVRVRGLSAQEKAAFAEYREASEALRRL